MVDPVSIGLGAIALFSTLFGGSQAAENASLRHQLGQAQQQLAAEKAENGQLKMQVAESEAKDQKIQRLETEVAGQNARLAQQYQMIADLIKDLAVMETRNQQLAGSNREFTEANSDWAKAFAREKEWADKTQDKLAAKDRKIADLISLNERAMESVHRSLLLGREVTALRKEVGMLKDQLTAAKDAVKAEKEGRDQDKSKLSAERDEAKIAALTAQENLSRTRADLETTKRTTLILMVAAMLLLVLLVIFAILLIRRSRSTPTRDPDDTPDTL